MELEAGLNTDYQSIEDGTAIGRLQHERQLADEVDELNSQIEDLNNKVNWMVKEIERLHGELAQQKQGDRLAAAVIMMQWGKEAVSNFMRAPI